MRYFYFSSILMIVQWLSCFADSGSFTTLPSNLPTGVPDYGVTYGAANNVASCCSSKSSKALIVWRDADGNGHPWYSIYHLDTKEFDTATYVDPSYTQGVQFDVYCSYNSKTNQAILTWGDLQSIVLIAET